MDTKRFMTGTVVGGIAMFVLGILIFDVALADFYAANAGSATGVARDAPLVWAIALGTFALAALVTLVIGHAGASGVSDGFKAGAVVGFLVWFGTDFIHYGNSNVWSPTLTIVDPLLEFVRTGIGGAVIALVLTKIGGEGSESAPLM